MFWIYQVTQVFWREFLKSLIFTEIRNVCIEFTKYLKYFDEKNHNF